MEERIDNIQKAASADTEGLVAPKNLWPSDKNDELDAWFEDRRKVALQPKTLDYGDG